ncbi:nucleolar protein 9 [Conger conger]|uniref:nucleolar protein 9 n=1 Tax=Conger conger TaxID=82655 RepID=UPI002A5AF979|nr:nucleolar protein 9 [Conger conger]XP_061111726.1 nucleolar protein 9 [Conger conger]XP_061111727.1 nucleolar protein 9 [Conger conger]XP_061111728.1 nucleolar protein 9 [Conger conger]
MTEGTEERNPRPWKGGEKNGKGRGKEERGRGHGGEAGARSRLDAMSVGYFRRVGDRLKEGFAEEEEKVLFVENVLTEVRGRALLVATDITGSITLQQLLPLAGPSQVGELLSELGGASGKQFRAASCDRCGGHVLEAALRQVPRWAEQTSEDTPEEAEAGHCGILEAQVLALSQVVTEEVEEFITHTHGSHVVRTLTHLLGGCLEPERSRTQPGGKAQKITPPLTDFEAPASFGPALRRLALCLLEHTHTCVRNAVSSAVLQALLTVCHRKRPILCKKLTKGIVGYLASLSSAPGVSPLLVFLKDQACSRLIEKIIQVSHKGLLRDLYKSHLRGQLVNLAVHPIANFPVQRLTAACSSYKMFLLVFKELMEGLEAILAAGHMGVIVQLADSCVQWEEKQGQLLQCLLEAFHCADPPSLQTSCLPLFLSLLTHEVYYGQGPAEGDTQRPLSDICYNGSRLVQSLAKFKERSVLLNSLRALSPADLLTLGTDQSGSHVLQALVLSASDKGRGKILRRLEGQYVQLACSRFGSRVLEAVWAIATVSQKQGIAQELAPSESVLRSDQFARHVWGKFGLTHFGKRRGQWLEFQTGQSKKRKMFSDILE